MESKHISTISPSVTSASSVPANADELLRELTLEAIRVDSAKQVSEYLRDSVAPFGGE